MIIRIKNLRLRTIIGVNDWERKNLQDVVVNAEIEYDASRAIETDDLEYAFNYRGVTKRIISAVESSRFHLLDALANHILQIIMDEPKVRKASVEVDKPNALRFADSVSASCRAERQ